HLHCALFRQLPPRASPAVLRALLQPAEVARDSDERPAGRSHGGAARLSERPAAGHRQARGRRPARRDRQQRTAPGSRHAHRRRPALLGLLTGTHRRLLPALDAGPATYVRRLTNHSPRGNDMIEMKFPHMALNAEDVPPPHYKMWNTHEVPASHTADKVLAWTAAVAQGAPGG